MSMENKIVVHSFGTSPGVFYLYDDYSYWYSSWPKNQYTSFKVKDEEVYVRHNWSGTNPQWKILNREPKYKEFIAAVEHFVNIMEEVDKLLVGAEYE